jgi:ATP-dependent helicase HrpB
MNRPTLPVLPIDDALPALTRALHEHTRVLLMAPPGAGKSTIVPLALLASPWLSDHKILMLEPRRLAARAVANRMAQLLGEPVGKTVGYRTRLDTRVGRDTRIEVVTEGILTRMLQRDSDLPGIGLVIFDEFHERSLNADLGLALCLESQATLREDLRRAHGDVERPRVRCGDALRPTPTRDPSRAADRPSHPYRVERPRG